MSRLLSLRVQVPDNYILTQNLYYHYYSPKPKYLIIGYLDPLGIIIIMIIPAANRTRGRKVFGSAGQLLNSIS